MNNPDLPENLWKVLDGRLWHATSTSGLQGILESGEIRITGTRDMNSFCRHLNCVSLFDFGNTEADVITLAKVNCYRWFGTQQDESAGIWLEIDRQTTTQDVYNAECLRNMWKSTRSNKKIIAGVEAGHQGPVPIAELKSAVVIGQDGQNWLFRHYEEVDESLIGRVASFNETLPPPSPRITSL